MLPGHQVVAKPATAVTLSVSPKSPVCGQPVSVCATVTAVPPSMAIPAGNVALTGPGGLNQTVTLDANGKACITITITLPGSDTTTATYSGSTSFNSSTANTPHLRQPDGLDLTASPAQIRLWPPSLATEDFALFGDAGLEVHGERGIRLGYWMLGAAGPAAWSRAPGTTAAQKLAALPANHAPDFAPDVRTALPAGVRALTTAALARLGAP
ncbi:Ig-like domain repeat protein [Streptomyces goshikiensis]|uniref:Ig-like domain-containing protein n=1 Tax=Streptomyces goshikiensis TaxID=1942 RepID=UPI0036761837